MQHVGVIGLGAMGEGVARNIAKSGFALTVHDMAASARDCFSAEGHSVSGTAEDLGARSEVVLLSLPGPAEVEAVCLGRSGPDQGGLAGSMRPGSLVIDLSTNDTTTIGRIGAALAERGIGFLDAPVSGGPWGARDGTLAIWVGGDAEAYGRAQPVFAAIARHVFHMGPLGTGTMTKLVHNLGATIRSLLVSEMLVFGLGHGIDPLKLFAAVREGSNGKARTFDLLGFKNLDQSYASPAFRLRHARKDMGIAMAAAEDKGLDLPATALCLSLLEDCMEQGMAELDSTAICRLVEARSGVSFPPVTRAEIDAVLAGKHDGSLT